MHFCHGRDYIVEEILGLKFILDEPSLIDAKTESRILNDFIINLYNINIGIGLIIIMLGGLLGVLVMANIVMLLSIKTKNMKVTAFLSVANVWIFVRLSSTYSQIKLLLNPIQFKSDSLLDEYLFIGNTLVPHFVAIFIVGILYIGSLSFLINRSYRKYRFD